MRRIVGVVFGVSALLLGASAPATAAPSTQPATPPAAPVAGAGQVACKITDSRITEVSGVVVTANGYAVENDGQNDRSREKVFFLDSGCKVTGTASYPSVAIDPEDLSVGTDNTIWVADIGDNTDSPSHRDRIALWSLPQGAKEMTIHRVAYPDGKHRDAEALIMGADNLPIIITKDPVGEIYTLDGTQLPANNTTPVKLKKVGQFTPEKTGTANPLEFLGWQLITGAARSPDGTRVTIRTLSDAYEFDVKNNDIVGALTSNKYRITPLPQEPMGEGIAYTADGKNYVTVADQPSAPTSILRYTPGDMKRTNSTSGANVPSPKTKTTSLLDNLSLQDITYMVGGVGVIGLLLVVAGVIGIRRSRAKRRAEPKSTRGTDPDGSDNPTAGPGGPPDDDGFGADPPRGRPAGVYGRPPADREPDRGGTVYGGGPGDQAPSREYDDGGHRRATRGLRGGGYADGGYPDGRYPDGGHSDGSHSDGGHSDGRYSDADHPNPRSARGGSGYGRSDYGHPDPRGYHDDRPRR